MLTVGTERVNAAAFHSAHLTDSRPAVKHQPLAEPTLLILSYCGSVAAVGPS